MKLDKIKFARLINFIGVVTNSSLSDGDIESIDELIDVKMPEPVIVGANASDVDALMIAIQSDRRIEAIKAYRNLTGCFLKESKDQVEKYWPKQDQYVQVAGRADRLVIDPHNPPADATLGDILASATHR